VRPSGFEPETCGLRVHCSAIELEAPCDLTPLLHVIRGKKTCYADDGALALLVNAVRALHATSTANAMNATSTTSMMPL
jgi:hypothetical protein